MKFKNLVFISMCISIALTQIDSQSSQTINMDYDDESIQFDELIFESLNFLQQKLANNTFTNEDMHVLMVLMEFILKMKENQNKRRKKEQTVYWLSRQGR